MLGPRLIDCAQALTELPGHDAETVFGGIDAMKLRSSMTLFSRADPEQDVFAAVLAQYFDGSPDEATERLLGH